ncbi:MAG: hypothetical protein K1X83_08380 [Oligoflexia bacterium]|nr:hypothetical protein [Oligoflexia bacterium]
MRLSLAALFGLVLVGATPSFAQEVKKEMRGVYQNFRDLQPYLYDAKAFEDPKNTDRVLKLIKTLSSNFHSVEKFPESARQEPGFAFNLGLINEMLDDAALRLKEGKRSYALWRLRTVSNSCIGCHVTFKASTAFAGGAIDKMKLDTFQKGEFYLATRQYNEAEQALIAVLKDAKLSRNYIRALRRLLVIFVRIKGEPQSALDKINELSAPLKLTTDERDEVKSWTVALQNWAKEPPETEHNLPFAERLIRDAVNLPDPLFDRVDAVELLRATAMLHGFLSKKGQPAEERSQTLYLLGFAYSRLPTFFNDALAELYLEQCISEFPGSYEAKRAYRLYVEVVTQQYTGSGGMNVPPDVDTRMLELHDKAFGVQPLDPKV